jgi:ubiquinol-cytochrome c reductase cytochrome b subunit
VRTQTLARTPSVARWFDDRFNLSVLGRKYLRKVFPDHWSFLLGEIALWTLVVLVVTGVFLTFWFIPNMSETTYEGSYAQLRGVPMSDAYASTLHISFDVRGGLLVRQMHHWAALMFIAAMLIHMMRIFLTGAFRKPREVTWVVGGTMLLLGVLEGFCGYSLPDDLLSGTGLRIADGVIKATPLVGTYLSFFLFNGEFPGHALIPRLYVVHVLLIPGLLLALVALHLTLIVYHKHTQWNAPGRAEDNVVGYPFLPVYLAKTTGFFFMVFGVLACMGALLSINPIWKYGPYDPSKVSAGAQPDWYLGIAEGLLRIMPNWETHAWGHTISWNVMLAGEVFALMPFALVISWPFVEAWVTGDRREHHLLQRPRDAPTRTAFLAATITVYGLLWAAGGNDILATHFHWSLNSVTYCMRGAIFIGPALVFSVTRRWCMGLQRADADLLLRGRETGIIVRSPRGGYSEPHMSLNPAVRDVLVAGQAHPEPTPHQPKTRTKCPRQDGIFCSCGPDYGKLYGAPCNSSRRSIPSRTGISPRARTDESSRPDELRGPRESAQPTGRHSPGARAAEARPAYE